MLAETNPAVNNFFKKRTEPFKWFCNLLYGSVLYIQFFIHLALVLYENLCEWLDVLAFILFDSSLVASLS